MKKIERLELKLVWELSEEKYRYSVYDKLNELTDAVNLLLKRDEENCLEKAKAELLETHTVKEERFIGKGQYEKGMPEYEEQEADNDARLRFAGILFGSSLWIDGTHEDVDEVKKYLVNVNKTKEEPTTPEKKCCDCFGKEPISLGVVLGGGEFKCQCKCHKEKLPSERIFEIREKGGKEVLPSNGEEYYVMPIAKAIMMYLDEQHKKK